MNFEKRGLPAVGSIHRVQIYGDAGEWSGDLGGNTLENTLLLANPSGLKPIENGEQTRLVRVIGAIRKNLGDRFGAYFPQAELFTPESLQATLETFTRATIGLGRADIEQIQRSITELELFVEEANTQRKLATNGDENKLKKLEYGFRNLLKQLQGILQGKGGNGRKTEPKQEAQSTEPILTVVTREMIVDPFDRNTETDLLVAANIVFSEQFLRVPVIDIITLIENQHGAMHTVRFNGKIIGFLVHREQIGEGLTPEELKAMAGIPYPVSKIYYGDICPTVDSPLNMETTTVLLLTAGLNRVADRTTPSKSEIMLLRIEDRRRLVQYAEKAGFETLIPRELMLRHQHVKGPMMDWKRGQRIPLRVL